MKNEVKELFISSLKNSKNDLIDKEDIKRLGEEFGLTFTKRAAKSKIIDKIIEEGHYERLFEAFSEFTYVPIWEVADYYKMNSDQIEGLNNLGIIKEVYRIEEFYNRRSGYYEAKIYPLSVFGYDKSELKLAYERAYNTKNKFRLRIETESEEQVHEIVKILSNVFEICESPSIYEKRNFGYYSYLDVKKLNKSIEEEKRLTYIIEQLKNDIVKVKEERNKIYANFIDRYYKIFGTSSTYELEKIKREYDELKKYEKDEKKRCSPGTSFNLRREKNDYKFYGK